MRRWSWWAPAILLACSGGGPSENVGVDEGEIVRPTAPGGRDQVVMVYATILQNGQLFQRTCSGTYFASRVVLTAAHCLDDVYLDQLFVYFGEDFAADRAQLVPGGNGLVPPAPGQPSSFAQADSYEKHPQWDPNLIHPDLGVVYVDRRLPFDPMPIERGRLGNAWFNKVVPISGWGANEATGGTTAIGSQVQRTGYTKILGSPTAADYHPEDPNPGMLDAAVRSHTLKADGRAPFSNGCFGDSGGPLLVKVNGQWRIGGVSYFTGLSCEDYSLYVRLDPFLPFLDRACRKGGNEKLVPVLDCVAPRANGGFTAYFGYENDNGIKLTVRRGANNSAPLDTGNFRPTLFEPGEHHFAFGVDFSAAQTVTYRLDPPNSPKTTLSATKDSPRCSAAQADSVECGNVCMAVLRSGCEQLPTFPQCMQMCLGNNAFWRDFAPQCTAENTILNECYASVPPGQSNWICIDPAILPDSPACATQTANLFACAGF